MCVCRQFSGGGGKAAKAFHGGANDIKCAYFDKKKVHQFCKFLKPGGGGK